MIEMPGLFDGERDKSEKKIDDFRARALNLVETV